MVLKFVRPACIVAAVLAAWIGAWDGSSRAYAQGYNPYGLIENNYTAGPDAGGLAPQLYPCPRPTPPLVGHTYISYPPLAPHEFLYHHARTYVTYHPDARATHTSVRWGGDDVANKAKRFFVGPNTKLFKPGLSDVLLDRIPHLNP